MIGLLRPLAAGSMVVVLLGAAAVVFVAGREWGSPTSLPSPTVHLPEVHGQILATQETPLDLAPGASKNEETEAPPALAKAQGTVILENPPQSSRVGATVPKERPKGSAHARPSELLTRMASHLHSEAHEQFVRANGFGRYREIPIMTLVNGPWKSPEWTSEELAKEQPPVSAMNDLSSIHRLSLNRFADSNTKTTMQRAGAQQADRLAKKDHFWQIKSLDLVGVVMHDTPVAYVSEQVPEMKDLKHKATRDLDVFESEGLEELSSGKDLYIRDKDNTVRLLGSIRAAKACLKCHHDSKVGDLLGAFSYTVRIAHIERRGNGRSQFNPQVDVWMRSLQASPLKK